MNLLRYDEARIVSTLNRVPPDLRTCFTILCAERLAPAFEIYCGLALGRKDDKRLVSILERLWRGLAGDRMTPEEVRAAQDHCRRLLPDEGEIPWINERDSADDAVAAARYALRCEESGSAQDAGWAARRVYEAFDSYAQARGGEGSGAPKSEAAIAADPLIQAELRRQQRDLDELLRIAMAPPQFSQLESLRDRARSDARQLFSDRLTA